jgi:hypothetical protein
MFYTVYALEHTSYPMRLSDLYDEYRCPYMPIKVRATMKLYLKYSVFISPKAEIEVK